MTILKAKKRRKANKFHLQRPQMEPGMKEEPEEDSKMICVSINDDFVLKQDICVMCGALGLGKPHFKEYLNSELSFKSSKTSVGNFSDFLDFREKRETIIFIGKFSFPSPPPDM